MNPWIYQHVNMHALLITWSRGCPIFTKLGRYSHTTALISEAASAVADGSLSMDSFTGDTRDNVLVQLCEWAYIAQPNAPGHLDEPAIKALIQGWYGVDWAVGRTGSFASPWSKGPHLPYFVAFNVKLACVVVVFQGSSLSMTDFMWRKDTLSDWLDTNIRLASTPYEFPPSIGTQKERAHTGFSAAYNAGSEQIFEDMRACAPSGPIQVVITGHSLGGALAKFAFVDFIAKQLAGQLEKPRFTIKEIYCATFSAPPIGNVDFEASFSQLISATKLQSGTQINGTYFEAKSEILGDYVGAYKWLTNNHYAPGQFEFTLNFNDSNFYTPFFPLCHYIQSYVQYMRSTAVPVPKGTRANASKITIRLMDVTCTNPINVAFKVTYLVYGTGQQKTETLYTGTVSSAGPTLVLEGAVTGELQSASRMFLSFQTSGVDGSIQNGVTSVLVFLDGKEALRIDPFAFPESSAPFERGLRIP